MKKLIRSLLVCAMALSLAACSPKPAAPVSSSQDGAQSDHSAQTQLDFPTKPITLICPWAAGGSSDLTCRKIAQMSKEYLGVEMNVVNREGGNGAVGLSELANTAAADGYTICMHTTSNFSTAPYVQDVEYSLESFAFLGGVTSEPLAVMVRGDSDLQDLQDIVELYQATQKPIKHGQSGQNGVNHMRSKQMFRNMGVEEEIVPYSGASEAIAALLGGEVDIILVHPGMVMGNIESGDVRVIAMVYNERVSAFPDVPTVEEQGFGKVHSETCKGFVVPAATDPAVVEFLSERLRAMFDSEEFTAFLNENGLGRSTYTGQEMHDTIVSDTESLWPIMEELGLLKEGAVKP